MRNFMKKPILLCLMLLPFTLFADDADVAERGGERRAGGNEHFQQNRDFDHNRDYHYNNLEEDRYRRVVPQYGGGTTIQENPVYVLPEEDNYNNQYNN